MRCCFVDGVCVQHGRNLAKKFMSDGFYLYLRLEPDQYWISEADRITVFEKI